MSGMWLRRLEVKDLAGIASAVIDLKPGVNVLCGPNELGKSSLVRAIRAALLLPSAAAAADELRDWHVDAPPYVSLTIEESPGASVADREAVWRRPGRFERALSSPRTARTSTWTPEDVKSTASCTAFCNGAFPRPVAKAAGDPASRIPFSSLFFLAIRTTSSAFCSEVLMTTLTSQARVA